MTDASSAPTDPSGPIDRRGFEEALRSQGFVVEPPDDGSDGPGEVDEAVVEQADASAPPAVPPAATDERPPVPGALLARIASKGQAPAATPGTGGVPPWRIAE